MSKFTSYFSSKSPLRWLLFLVVTVILGVTLLALPPQFQRLSFGVMIGTVLAVMLLELRHQYHPLKYARVSFVIAIALFGCSAYFYQLQHRAGFIGFYLFLLSLPFIRLSFILIPTTISHANQDTLQGQDVIRWHWVVASILFMTLLTMSNIPTVWVQPFHHMLGLVDASPHSQMLLLALGLVSLIHGFGGHLLPRRIKWQRHHTILLGIVLLGGAIRLWKLETTIHMFVDEFFFLRDVANLNTMPQSILFPTTAPTTDIFAYLQMQFVNLLEPSLTSFRLVTPLFSMLALVVVYGLVRQLFAIRVALISAFLLAVLPVYIHFGRIGMNMVVDPIFGMLGFTYFLRGLRHHQLSDFAMAGIAFGLTHYFYEGGRIFLTLFFICWFIWSVVFCRRDPLFRLPTIKQLLVMVVCFLMVSLPVYHTLWSHNQSFMQRLNATRSPDHLIAERLTEFMSDIDLGHLGAPIQRYVQTPARDNFYQSDDAYILPVLVPFFLLGLGVLLWQLRTLRGALLVWWALGVAIANGLISDMFSAPSPRHIVVYGILMVITAVGIYTVWSVLTAWLAERWHRWISICFVLYLGCIGVYQVNYYFHTIVPNFHENVFTALSVGSVRRPAYDDMILRAVTLPENTTLHVFTQTLFSHNHRIDVPEFYGRFRDEFRVDHMMVSHLTVDYFENLPADRHHVFTFTQQYAPPIIDMIEQVFDITKIEASSFDIPDDVEMIFYYTQNLNAPISETHYP